MKYLVELKPRAIKDLKGIPQKEGKRIVEKLRLLENNLQGDVKRLTNYTPEYRMRVGDWRILFEIEDEKIIVYRIRHRKEAYK
jgi:mRNA interferase RelE/StbE